MPRKDQQPKLPYEDGDPYGLGYPRRRVFFPALHDVTLDLPHGDKIPDPDRPAPQSLITSEKFVNEFEQHGVVFREAVTEQGDS